MRYSDGRFRREILRFEFFMGLTSFIFVIVIVLGLFWIGVKLHLFENKGDRGERIVSSKLFNLPSDYLILNDVLLRRPNGSTTQIDHIVIAMSGIFVIETKNYSGKVYGSENSDYWKEYFNWFSRVWYKYGHHSESYSFYNPIKQNQGHINALRKLLSSYENLPFFSIIVFSNDAELHVNSSSALILQWRYLDAAILKFNHSYLTEDQVHSIYQTITDSRIEVTEETKTAHVFMAQEAKAAKEERLRNGKCPRCGGELVLRNGKYGKFYGCSNYPKCRYTHPC